MAKKKLKKKVVLTADLKGLTEADFVTKAETFVQGAIDNASVVPGLNPNTTVEQGKIDTYKNLLSKGETLKNQQKANTELIVATRADINNDIVSKWMPYAQAQVGDNIDLARALGYGIKGQRTAGTGINAEKAAESHPAITRIDEGVHLQHTLHTVNSHSGKNKLPPDAKHIEIYEQIGGTVPTGIKSMTRVGICKHGKFINHFTETDLGKTVYYIAVYVDKKSLMVLEQSPVESAIVN